MVTVKASVAAVILAGTAAISAGVSYAVTRSVIQTNVAVRCPLPPPASAGDSGVPLGGTPLATNQGKKW